MQAPPGDELPDHEELIRQGIERFKRGESYPCRPRPRGPGHLDTVQWLYLIGSLAGLIAGGGAAVWFYPEATISIIVGAGSSIILVASPRKAIPWFLFLIGICALLLSPVLGVILILTALAIKILLL
jgi:hypothetical protein